MKAANVLNVLLAHQEPGICAGLIRRAAPIAKDGLLLAYGGNAKSFSAIAYNPKIFIEDERLRTRDHQRQFQSYSEIFRSTSNWMKGQAFEFVHFFEYDHVPLVHDLNIRQQEKLHAEAADVLGFRLERIDDTSHPHYLHHATLPAFQDLLRQKSCRTEKDVVLSMLLTGSFWTRETFDSVARSQEPCPVYMEVYLPTLAHHLGFRLRGYGKQEEFVSYQGDWSSMIESARSRGAWTVHPVKSLPT